MVLKVATLGIPLLRRKARPVDPREIPAKKFQNFLDSLIETMREYEGVGVAAPQVSVPKRIFCVECRRNRRYPGTPQIPLYVVINPRIRILDRKNLEMMEGCLSIPGFRGQVPRVRSLELRGLDRYGKPFRIVARGFHARIIQHEWDHLQGKVFLDRMIDFKTLTFFTGPRPKGTH